LNGRTPRNTLFSPFNEIKTDSNQSVVRERESTAPTLPRYPQTCPIRSFISSFVRGWSFPGVMDTQINPASKAHPIVARTQPLINAIVICFLLLKILAKAGLFCGYAAIHYTLFFGVVRIMVTL